MISSATDSTNAAEMITQSMILLEVPCSEIAIVKNKILIPTINATTDIVLIPVLLKM